MSVSAWQNLALLLAAALYIMLFSLELGQHNTCGRLAVDFCSFWSAGYVANHNGYPAVYDLTRMEQVQRAISPIPADPGSFVTTPTPFLPVFIVPFQLFALFGPSPGYWVWAALNLGLLIWYLRFFARKTTGQPLQPRLLALSLLSWPVFLNLFAGQINIFLVICVGEFLRAAMQDRPFASGLWLAGLLLKPQFLLLLGLVLLLQRSFRALGGLLVGSSVVGLLSALLLGADGLRRLAQLWTLYARGQQETLAVGVMMNWRMIGLHLAPLLSPAFAWTLAALGIVLTLLGFLYLWRRHLDPKTPSFAIALLGTLAATGLVAWHSHYTAAIFMLSPMIFLSQPVQRLPRHGFFIWAFLPTALYLAAWPEILLLDWLAPSLASALPSYLFSGIFLSALGMFGLNLYLLVWAILASRKFGSAVSLSLNL